MIHNPIIETLLSRKSIRRYRDEMPSCQMIQAIVRAGQQAPFAAQLYSIIVSGVSKNRCGAPVLFTICVDLHKLEVIMKRRNWCVVTNDLSLLLLGTMDACFAAQNMVIAADSLGLGSCFLSIAPKNIGRIVEECGLPERVFPLVQLAVGYPAQQRPTRPRFPLEFMLFEDEYPEFSEEHVQHAMNKMDHGYLEQGYYEEHGMWPLTGGRAETFGLGNYSWTEHVSRKWGQRWPSLEEMLEQLALCGFRLNSDERREE